MKYPQLPNPFEDAARGRDPVPMSSGGSTEGRAVASPVKGPDVERVSTAAGIESRPPETKRKRGRPKKGEKK